VDKVLRAPLK